jgi:hypothetical protein
MQELENHAGLPTADELTHTLEELAAQTSKFGSL